MGLLKSRLTMSASLLGLKRMSVQGDYFLLVHKHLTFLLLLHCGEWVADMGGND
jgi:hypothetical protein